MKFKIYLDICIEKIRINNKTGKNDYFISYEKSYIYQSDYFKDFNLK